MKPAVFKRKVKKALYAAGLDISFAQKRGHENLPGYIEDEFKALYKKYWEQTMVPWSGLYSAYKAIEYILARDIPGDIVECGVWRGGCSALMLETLKLKGKTDRKIYLYDTFEGMTPPTEKDVHFSGAQNAITEFEGRKKKGEKWSYGPFETAKANILSSGYPEENITFIKGDVLETLKTQTPDKIALLRLDTDWYESTMAEMNTLFPLLQKDGIFICDDYGSWKGSYDAVTEYFSVNNINMFLQVDPLYGGAVGVKP